ncbi:MAG: hypothetical protein ACLGH0_07040 [Thermoanaerobaculia bacterium]
MRLRNAAVAPMAAFLFAQVYFTIYPLLPRVPAALFWFVAAVLLAGVVTGAVLIIRAAERNVWLIAATAAELLCLWQLLSMVVPWL